jgi:3-oxoacyl-[acyl-carrier protein] reductase
MVTESALNSAPRKKPAKPADDGAVSEPTGGAADVIDAAAEPSARTESSGVPTELAGARTESAEAPTEPTAEPTGSASETAAETAAGPAADAPREPDEPLDLSSAARAVAAMVVTERRPSTAPEPVAEGEAGTASPELAAARVESREDLPVEAPEPGEVVESTPQLTFGGTPAARVALVTGAGRGIGRAIAVGLGRAGLDVALLGRSPEALEDVAAEVASHGVGASWAGADVRDFAQVQNAVERLEAALGDIDLLINNSGAIEPVEVPVWDAGPETWWHVVETDLRGPFHCVRAVVPGMIARGGGRVVNLSSGVGAEDRDIYSAYAAAKAGLFRITGSLHLAFEISPGVVRTDMSSAMSMHSDRTQWTPVARVVDLVVAAAGGELDAWSGAFLHAGVDTPESLDAAELRAGEAGLPPRARRLGILPYASDDPLITG